MNFKQRTEEAQQVIKTLGGRIERHKSAWHNSIEPACRILEDEYKKLEALNLPKLLAVFEAAKKYVDEMNTTLDDTEDSFNKLYETLKDLEE